MSTPTDSARPALLTQAAELLAQGLENEGVRYVLALPGEEIGDLFAALAQST